VLGERCPGWQVALLTHDARLAHNTGLAFDPGRAVALVNGGVRVKLFRGEVAAAAEPGAGPG